jgi:peptide/nickel transport system substrate-binding protein
MVPISSPSRRRIAVLIQEQLRLAGVRVNIELLDGSAMTARLRAHTFDAAMAGLTTTPSPSGVRQTWSSQAAIDGGFNFGRYVSGEFDAALDSALAADDQNLAKVHYGHAYRIIVSDAPAVWLYEQPNLIAFSARLRIGTTISDAWWTGIPRWSIEPVGDVGRHVP